MPVLPFWLAVPALAFMLIIPGFVTLQLILGAGKTQLPVKASGLKRAEQVFWSLTLSLSLAGWVSLTLAELGFFSIWLVLGLVVGWSAIGFGWLWRGGYRQAWWRERLTLPDRRKIGLDGWLLVALLTGATGLLYFAPHETLAGSQDSGVYYATGANIARTGKLINYDPLLQGVWQVSQDPAIGPKVIPLVLQGPAKQENRALFARHLRLPGFFVPDNEDGLAAGQTVPQGFHLYPSFLALGYGLFGVRGESLVTPLFGIMAIFAVYLACTRLFPARRQRWIAPVATLLLLLNSIQVWFSRESLWEMLGEFLVFTAIYAFCLIKQTAPDANETEVTSQPASLAILGGLGVGLAFGLICLAHSQFPFLVWVLAPYLIWIRLTRRWGAAHWWLLITFGLLFFQTVLHIRIFSLAYWEYIFHNVIIDIRSRLSVLIPVGASLLFGLIALDARPDLVLKAEKWLTNKRSWIGLALAALSLLYSFYTYFILVLTVSVDQHSHYPTRYWSLSSYIGAPTTEGSERNLLRLGWYFSPVGMLLVFFGLAWLLWRRLDSKIGFMLAVMGGITLIFLDTNYTQESYIYSLRRYLVVTVPVFSIFMAVVLFETIPEIGSWLSSVWSKRRRIAYARPAGSAGNSMAFAVMPVEVEPAVTRGPAIQENRLTNTGKAPRWSSFLGAALTLALVVFMVWTGKTVYGLSEYGATAEQPGLIAQFDELAARFGPKDMLLFAGDRDPDGKIATPLTYIYGHPGFVLTDAVKNDEVADLISHWEGQGYHVKAMLGPNGGRFAPTGYELKFESAVTIRLHQFEQLSIQKPYGVQLNTLSYAIYDLTKVGKQASFTASAGQGQPESPAGWNLVAGQNDYAALVGGFYEAEKDPDGTGFRWTNQSGIVRVPCMVPEGTAGQLSLTLSAGKRPANKGPVKVAVYLSNYRYADETGKRVELGTVELTSDPQTFSLDIPANQPYLSCSHPENGNTVNSLIVWLSNDQPTTFVPAQSGDGNPDARQLSFKVYQLILHSGK